MSKIVEKTVNSLQAYVSRNILRGEFLLQDFTLDIASAASKEDENEIIARKLSALEQDMKDYSKTDRIEEYLLQAMYLEMLGHPTPFAYVHAVKLLQQGQLNQKLIGYLATTVFLDPSHELVVLLINSIQRDLASKVSLVVVMALEIIPKLIHGEFALAVEPLVIEKTKHYSSAVRKAALVTLQHCYSQCGSTQIPLAPVRILEKGLADTEINVVSSAAQCIRACAKDNGGEIGHLCSPLLDVLSQLRLKRVHSDYEFGGISAPWLQLTILSALGHLQLDKEQTENVLSTLKEILDSRIVNQTIYYGILWESLNTLSKVLTAGSPLQKSAVDCIAKMLHSNSTDLNYSGVDALERVLAKCCPSEAVTCQDVIIDCLHHPDESVRIKTLNLLITMANATNVAAIVQRVLKYASTVGDYSVRSFVCEKIIHLLKLYSGDVRWCATTFINLLLIAPSHITEATVLHFINIFKKEEGAVLPCIIPELLKADAIYCGKNASLMILLAWAIGEVKPDMPSGCSFLESVQKLLVILEACQHDSHLCLCILTSLSKLLLNWKRPLQDDMGTLTCLASSDTSPLVKQRSQELLRWNKLLQQEHSTLENGDYEKEYFKVDTTLSFLDGYMCKALEAGAMPYKPRVFTAVTLEDVRTESAAVFNLDIAGTTCCSESEMDVFSPDYHSFASDVPFSESSEKASPWSATGRRKSESKDHVDTRLEGKNVDSSKQEDVELLKTLFSPISSTNAAKAASVVSPDFSSGNVDAASSSGLQQRTAAVSKSAELWGIELKRHS
ncbi:AP-4 complex subunit epsilon-1-like isoform X1 [Dermacentor variabilis]|uniref:AP-4 complex subunit epsilon-1-like isoform X1 n=2 Tax=Dermacentor variabilis TaxID=34621 RepID=UPI003F5C2358